MMSKSWSACLLLLVIACDIALAQSDHKPVKPKFDALTTGTLDAADSLSWDERYQDYYKLDDDRLAGRHIALRLNSAAFQPNLVVEVHRLRLFKSDSVVKYEAPNAVDLVFPGGIASLLIIVSTGTRGDTGSYELTIGDPGSAVVQQAESVQRRARTVPRPSTADAAAPGQGQATAATCGSQGAVPNVPLVYLELEARLNSSVNSAAWLGSGDSVLFSAKNSDQGYDETTYLWRGTGEPVSLTYGGVVTPAPDGKRFAFARDQSIMVRNLLTGEDARIGDRQFGDADRLLWLGGEPALLVLDNPGQQPMFSVLDLDALQPRNVPLTSPEGEAVRTRLAVAHPAYRWAAHALNYLHSTGWMRNAAGVPQPNSFDRGVYLFHRDACLWQRVLAGEIYYAELSASHTRMLTISGPVRSDQGTEIVSPTGLKVRVAGEYVATVLAIWNVREVPSFRWELRMTRAPEANVRAASNVAVYPPHINPITGRLLGANRDALRARGVILPPRGADSLLIHVTSLVDRGGIWDGDVVVGDSGEMLGTLVGVRGAFTPTPGGAGSLSTGIRVLPGAETVDGAIAPGQRAPFEFELARSSQECRSVRPTARGAAAIQCDLRLQTGVVPDSVAQRAKVRERLDSYLDVDDVPVSLELYNARGVLIAKSGPSRSPAGGTMQVVRAPRLPLGRYRVVVVGGALGGRYSIFWASANGN